MTEPLHDPQLAADGPAERRQLQVGTRHAVLDISVQVIGRLGNLALGVAVTLVLVHALGPRSFGAWSAILALVQIASNFGDLGLSQITILRAVAEPERERFWLGALVSLRMALAVPITVGAAIAVFFIISGSNARIAGLLLVATIMVGAAGAIGVLFTIRVRNDIPTALLTVNSVLWLLGVVVVSAAGGEITAFAAAFLVVNAITTLLTVVLAVRWGRPTFKGSWHGWPPLLRVGVTVAAAGMLVTTYVKLDQILVYELAGSRQAGLYGAAYRILDQAQFIPISVMTTLFPLIASAYPADVPRVRRLLQIAAEYLSMGSLGALAFTIAAAKPIMVLLFGASFAAAAPALPVLMAAFVLISFGYLFGYLVVVVEIQKWFVLFALIAVFVNVGLNLLLIPPFGFQAAAWITVVTELVVLSLTARLVMRRLDMKPDLRRLGRITAAAALTGAVVFGARAMGVPLGGMCAIAVVVYPALLIALRALSPRQVLALARHEPI